jgi:hypothetical protein
VLDDAPWGGITRRYGVVGASFACECGLPTGSGPGRWSDKMWVAPVKSQGRSVGLDVHARLVVGCGVEG